MSRWGKGLRFGVKRHAPVEPMQRVNDRSHGAFLADNGIHERILCGCCSVLPKRFLGCRGGGSSAGSGARSQAQQAAPSLAASLLNSC